MAQLRYFSISTPPNHHISISTPCLPSISLLSPSCHRPSRSLSLLQTKAASISLSNTCNNDGNNGNNNNNGKGNGNGKGNNNNNDDDDSSNSNNQSEPSNLPIIGSFINGWRSRVLADPQFPFKVLMEEIVGVSACVLGDMASRPNFGLNELDFVFSTLIVGSIVNFLLMYLLAPTMAHHPSTQYLPSIFSNFPQSHMFESGSFSLFDRMGTFVYKGVIFASVGFVAGLVGTAISNGLMELRKKVDPEFESGPKKGPPTMLNALTWAIHMGLSSNFRYQTLNGVEFWLGKGLSPMGFKASVVGLRGLNNVVGGVSFVMLARLTGSQKVEESTVEIGSGVVELEDEKEKLVVREDGELQSNQSHCK